MFLRSGERLFQSRGAERLNALAPMMDGQNGGTKKLMEEADLCPGGAVDLDKVKQVWGDKVMDSFESIEEELKVKAVFDGEPVGLAQFEFTDKFVGETKQEGVALIQAEGD